MWEDVTTLKELQALAAKIGEALQYNLLPRFFFNTQSFMGEQQKEEFAQRHVEDYKVNLDIWLSKIKMELFGHQIDAISPLHH